jgi:glycosyltransferase involved in cell wall biosynthesis
VRLHPAWTLPDIDGGYLNAVALADKAFKALRHDPPSVIVASGPRFANFLAARWLARAFAAHLVLHYRDEWTVNTPAFVQNTPRDREEEALCLEQADLASFVSEGKRDVYCAAFPHLDPAKFMVVPNGWEPYFHEKAQNTRHLPADAFTVTYTGRWHASLAPLLGGFTAALARWPNTAPRLLLVVVGNQLPENERLLAAFRARHPNNILVREATTPTTAIEIQRDSAALLLINDHLYCGVVPLKTFDYLCSGRPILVFGRSGGAAEIVRSLGAGLSVSADEPQAFGDALIALLYQPAAWDTPERRAWCARHSRAVLFGPLFAAIAALGRAPSPVSDAVSSERAAFVKSGTAVRSDLAVHG